MNVQKNKILTIALILTLTLKVTIATPLLVNYIMFIFTKNLRLKILYKVVKRQKGGRVFVCWGKPKESQLRRSEASLYPNKELMRESWSIDIRFSIFREEENIVTESSAKRIVIVIPTLNERKAVGKVLGGVEQVMEGYEYRVLVVDGHSTDGTDEIARDMGADVIYQRGEGYGDALKTGFFHARKRLDAKVVVMMDADSTYDPQHIPELVAPVLKDEADLVVGNRFAGMQKGAMPFVNRIGNKVLSLVAKLVLGLNVYDTQSGMRAFKSELLEHMNLVAAGMPLAMEILAEACSVGARIREVPISYRARVGETKLNPIKDGGRILGITVRLMFDVRPLLFFGSIGTVLGVVGLFLHYMMPPIDLVNVVFPFLFMIGGMFLLWIGFMMVLIKKLRRRK